MSDWGWVGLAYGVVYITLGAYLVSLVRRLGQVREDA